MCIVTSSAQRTRRQSKTVSFSLYHQSVTTSTLEPTLYDLFAEHYCSLGATGRGAIRSMWEDYAEGRLSSPEWLSEMEATDEEVADALAELTLDVIASGCIDFTFGVDC